MALGLCTYVPLSLSYFEPLPLEVNMERIPEEELMTDAGQSLAYAEADFSDAHDAFVSHFKERFPGFRKGDVLDLGCGPGDITMRFALALPETRITGVDGSQSMLDLGLEDVSRRGLSQRISLKKVFLPDDILLNSRFDAVISNSLLHHLSSSSVLWQTIRSCAKKAAPVFVMDLLRPENIDIARALVEQHAAEISPVVRSDFFNSLLAAYTVEEVEHQLTVNGLDFLNVEVISDRHLIIWGLMR
jgi:cyclopropane fatty-acyl-phospholipid synthase-like methyltransferase